MKPVDSLSGLSEHLSAHALTRRFGAFTALDAVSLSIRKGEFVCLLGPSGCGKTTLLRLIAGLDLPDAGAIHLSGRDITRAAPASRDYGIVFQSYALFPNLTVADNISYGLRPRRDREGHARRVRELLDIVGLAGADGRYPSQLSGGQQQRVALARALATSPGLLLLDEPLSALDARVRDKLREELKGLQRRLGVTTLMVTHDQEEALAIADRVVVMNAGRIEQVGTPSEIYRRPASRFVAEFVGDANWLPATRLGAREAGIGGCVLGLEQDLPDCGALTLFLRPEDIIVKPRWEPAPNTLLARVEDVAFGGAMTDVRLRPEGMPGVTLRAEVCPSMLNRQPLLPGEIVPVELPAALLRAYPREAAC
ncbi:putative 2-aminoethylphosphonate ABC transporter ATP-binding protein [Chromobacterium sp. ATCC 53434]|uniref:putative 2-aminoethylphosphonate ABC transporter ATP-binding protein n=1 Tax=Chromobacterium sp. (strain ATCC 53434 / SC 14030) TaxID=2059672 RepID=UPI000C784C4D|nr:putative 2-aminoethylphosphonate ABC transporter ATP-binding protein [Chromobacterium sp. ATCC 53434]AUH51683.1 putative 2-aminoethylphosphonate ABC transporter ATP-binding protein [Chromobacterium sp. ATCC 53434]